MNDSMTAAIMNSRMLAPLGLKAQTLFFLVLFSSTNTLLFSNNIRDDIRGIERKLTVAAYEDLIMFCERSVKF